MSYASRHQGRTAWCLPARDRGSGNGGDCVQGTCGRRFVKEVGESLWRVFGQFEIRSVCRFAQCCDRRTSIELGRNFEARAIAEPIDAFPRDPIHHINCRDARHRLSAVERRTAIC